jgi:branched-chain amino acid transport system ATP-binding protein
MLTMSGVCVKINGADILNDVHLRVEPHTLCGLLGRNGAGKTTLMRAVMGALPIAKGSLTFDGCPIAALPAHQRARLGIGYMPEDRRLVPDLSVEENVLLPFDATGSSSRTNELDRVFAAIPELVSLRKRPAVSLSGGQQKLVALGRAIAIGTSLLLLDEPTEGVAPSLAKRLIGILREIRAQGPAILISDSNERHLDGLVDRLYLIDRGHVALQFESTVGVS